MVLASLPTTGKNGFEDLIELADSGGEDLCTVAAFESRTRVPLGSDLEQLL